VTQNRWANPSSRAGRSRARSSWSKRTLRRRRFVLLLGFVVWSVIVSAGPVWAHAERDAMMPDGSGHVPQYRTTGPELVVCSRDEADFLNRIKDFPAELQQRNLSLYGQCQSGGFRDLQAAVDAVDAPGYRILVLPGLYQEPPSFQAPSAECANRGTQGRPAWSTLAPTTPSAPPRSRFRARGAAPCSHCWTRRRTPPMSGALGQ
jgi:hypothetical protein